MSSQARPGEARWFYLVLTAAWVVLLVYGSWWPFEFHHLQAGTAWERFLQKMDPVDQRFSKNDLLANTLLGMPLSFLALGALGRRLSLDRVVLVICGAWTTSFLVEFVQVYLPIRSSSPADILAQWAGTLLGLGMWFAVGPILTHSAGSFLRKRFLPGLRARVLVAYAATLFVYWLHPFLLTLHPASLYHKYRDGQIVLLPFSETGGLPFPEDVLTVALMLPLGFLLFSISRSRWPALWATLWSLAFALFIECCQVLSEMHTASATHIVLAWAGGTLGVLSGSLADLLFGSHDPLV